MSERGKFIVNEGVGGAGKTTQVELAAAYLRSKKYDVKTTREPGGDIAAEELRQLIFDLREQNAITPEQQVALFFATRRLWVRNVIAPQVEKGVTVLSDRTFPSTAAYQGYAEGADMQMIENLTRIVMDGYLPDAIILIDVSAKTAKRRNSPKNERDPYDDQELAYFEKVVKGYRKMAASNWLGIPWHVVNGEQSIEAVAQEIRKRLDLITNGT